MNDGCLFRRIDEIGEVIICAYVDNMLIVGDIEAVDDTHRELGDAFNITIEEATEFLGCKWSKEEKGYLIHHPDLLHKMETTFGEEVKNLKNFPTPSGEGFRVNKVNEGEEHLSDNKQNRYRNGIGLSLYLS